MSRRRPDSDQQAERQAAPRVLVCGSRGWSDRDLLASILEALDPATVVIVGGAQGADKMAEAWCHDHGLDLIVMPANWRRHGKAAGPIRNHRMLDLGPDEVIAFRAEGPSPGTDDCCEEARRRGIEVHLVVGP